MKGSGKFLNTDRNGAGMQAVCLRIGTCRTPPLAFCMMRPDVPGGHHARFLFPAPRIASPQPRSAKPDSGSVSAKENGPGSPDRSHLLPSQGNALGNCLQVRLHLGWLDAVAAPAVVDDEQVAKERQRQRMVDAEPVRAIAHQHRNHSATHDRLHQQS